MCLPGKVGARRADLSSLRAAWVDQEVAPAPSHWIFVSREKWKPEKSRGKANRGRVTSARRGEWVAKREGEEEEVAKETHAGGSSEARDPSGGGAG